MISFQPLPLMGNPHVQTILGSLWSGMGVELPAQSHVVTLPDGDQLLLHETPPRRSERGQPVALLIHGLGGSSQSSYLERTTQRLSDLGWRVFRLNLRAAGAGVRLARRFYTAACSPDVNAVVHHLHQAYPTAPIALVGFSLGGNIALKWAGEAGAQPMPNVCAVAAVAPPIDLVRCCALIAEQPFYDAFFVRYLTGQVRKHQRYFTDVPRIVFPQGLTLREFDEMYTAPRWGYASALDYYRQASAFAHISAIRLPTFILTARDDPFVAIEPFERLRPPASVTMHISAQGGHCGFLGRDAAGGIRWAETQVVNWLMKQI